MIYPVLDTIPNFQKNPLHGIRTEATRSGLSPARETVFFPETAPEETVRLSFAFEDGSAAAMKEFFRARGGQRSPFYLPSWKNDLPPISGAEGETQLLVSWSDYAAELADATGDGRTKAVWLYQPGHGLFVAAVVTAGEPDAGQTLLTLDRYLQWDVNPITALCGFLRLCRFADESLRYNHLTADVAELSADFVTVAAARSESEDFEIAPISYSNFLGFSTATAEQEQTPPADARVALAMGPATLGTGGTNSDQWAAWVAADGLRIEKTTDEIVLPRTSGALTALISPGPVDTTHLALCFEGNGREMLAYESGQDEITLIRRLALSNASYTWEGRCPVLATLLDLLPTLDEDATPACYYIRDGDPSIYVRYASELFATERTAAVLPVRLIELRSAEILSGRIVLHGIDSAFRHVTITSPLYE